MTQKRRNYTPEEKVSILRKHLLEKAPVSDLCDQHGLHSTVFHRWLKDFFEKGALAFQKPKDSRILRLTKKTSWSEGKLPRRRRHFKS